jgi:hypothetical protein
MSAPTWRRWTAAWTGALVLGFVNAGIREWSYGRRMRELTAHQLSTVTLIAFLGAYIWALDRRWPIPSARAALGIGGTWSLLTTAFEFTFGRLQGKSWSELLRTYDIREGRLWGTVPATLALAPVAAWKLRQREEAT